MATEIIKAQVPLYYDEPAGYRMVDPHELTQLGDELLRMGWADSRHPNNPVSWSPIVKEGVLVGKSTIRRKI